MIYENVCAFTKFIELLYESFNPVPSFPWKLGIPFNPGKAVTEAVVIKAKFKAEVRNDVTEPGVEVLEVPDHMGADMRNVFEHGEPDHDLSSEFIGNFIK
ncbi:hypothetical protein ROS1_57820 [Roseibium sp. ROS1]